LKSDSFDKVFSSALPVDKDIINYIDGIRNNLGTIEPFYVTGFGPSDGNDTSPETKKSMVTGKILTTASTDRYFGNVLYKIASGSCIRANGSISVIELGTCVGISAMYIIAGLASSHGGHICTFEGIPEFGTLAQENISHLIEKFNFSNVTFDVIVGPFDKTIPDHMDTKVTGSSLAFIDGNHLEEPTLTYHHDFRKRMKADSIIVHDDIGWSDGMERAWAQIVKEEGAGRCIELQRGYRSEKGIVITWKDEDGLIQKVPVDNPLTRPLRGITRIMGKR